MTQTRFDLLGPEVAGEPIPEVMPCPHDEGSCHPLAKNAAERLKAELSLSHPRPTEGKMWGVLVAQRADGAVGFLRAHSGQHDDGAYAEGAVPPLFDVAARAAIEVEGEARVTASVFLRAAIASDPGARAQADALDALLAAHRLELDVMDARNVLARSARQERRLHATAEQAAALDDESRRLKSERRRRLVAQEAERAPLIAAREGHLAQLIGLDAARQEDCAALMRAIFDTYTLTNALGERVPLRQLYALREPPSGAGDCAAPKLIGAAVKLGLRPLALTEFWWGPAPPGGGRTHGRHFAACQTKCGPLLPFLLRPHPVADRRTPPSTAVPFGLVVRYADRHLLVVEKPAGLLSVPGRGPNRQDSVLARLRASYPDATGPLLVHRLDEDTSGLLIVALSEPVYVALQGLFLRRQVEKRYVGCVRGQVVGESGEITLSLRPDVDDRPRQLHDPVRGKPCLTRWQVCGRSLDQTRLILEPLTGRTHQLRVHLSHPKGLGTPLLGDRLYGEPGGRLLLHATALKFVHPVTAEVLALESPPEF